MLKWGRLDLGHLLLVKTTTVLRTRLPDASRGQGRIDPLSADKARL